MFKLTPSSHRKTILGMVHLQPLPGTPFYRSGSMQEIMDRAVRSAHALSEGGADGCLIQTVDRTYLLEDQSDEARIAAMSLIVQAVVDATPSGFQIGVQFMANATRASLAVAKVAGGSFVRSGPIVGVAHTPHGLVQPDSHRMMQYRASIEAWSILVIADLQARWHSSADTMSIDVRARATKQVGADAVALGSPEEAEALGMIRKVRAAVPDIPILLSGHTHHENASRLLAEADGAFVGTCLERNGWGGEVDLELVQQYMEIVRRFDR
jgi:membrane complex biogenesis BtpA family protein